MVDVIDDAAHVAVALVVAGPAEPGDRHVVDVAGDEVVAVLGALLGDHVEVELAVGALADESALVIGEGDDHGVDHVLPDVRLELEGADVLVLGHGHSGVV